MNSSEISPFSIAFSVSKQSVPFLVYFSAYSPLFQLFDLLRILLRSNAGLVFADRCVVAFEVVLVFVVRDHALGIIDRRVAAARIVAV